MLSRSSELSSAACRCVFTSLKSSALFSATAAPAALSAFKMDEIMFSESARTRFCLSNVAVAFHERTVISMISRIVVLNAKRSFVVNFICYLFYLPLEQKNVFYAPKSIFFSICDFYLFV